MARTAQPTYDFLVADPSPPRPQPVKEVFQQSTALREISTEDLRAQLKSVQYELDTLKQERELNEFQRQQDLRDVQSRGEAEFKRAQAAETARDAAARRADALTRDFQEAQDRTTNEKLQLEKRIRALQDDNRSLREDLEEVRGELETQERQSRHASGELEQRHAALQASAEDMQQDLSGKVAALQMAQQKLAQKENEVGQLENEVLRLKAQTGDSDTLALIKKELSEQVTHIRSLEATNRDQLAELKQSRKVQKTMALVEEEKRVLQAQVQLMDELRSELSEAQIRKSILEDERRGWTTYLENEATQYDDMRFETPEQMAKALLQERLEKINLLDKLGVLQPDMSAKEENIQGLQAEKAQLLAEMERLRGSGGTVTASTSSGDSKSRARLERQKTLVVKEVEYLRAQMKLAQGDEEDVDSGQAEAEHVKRVRELEDMVDQYRAEVQTLQTELATLEAQPIVQSPKKRGRGDDEDDERLGELQRRARTLQDELDKLQTRNRLLETELTASVSQVQSLQQTSRTRVLELRNNPTAEAEAIKMATLRTLRDENAALVAQVEGRAAAAGGDGAVVPASTADNLRQQIAEKQAQIAQMEKKALRLRQVWKSTSLEFREAVCSLLGWKLDFLANGRVKATSILHPKTYAADGEEVENSIEFDGEKGTMKISGGPQSVFAGEIKGLIEYWLSPKINEVPCFLAACTLEFYERTTRAQKM